MLSDPRARRLLCTTVILLLFLAGCNAANITAPENTAIAIRPAIHRFDLSARQGLRDFANDFAVGRGGADTGIAVVPGERVEIFASGSASIGPGGGRWGPQGDAGCRQEKMPQPDLPCYAVVYSVGMAGQAGVVGAHASFIATTSGNIFLGVNSPDLARDSGSFHMTVVTIPPGELEGIWAAPSANFAVQGTELTLSALAFAQGIPIEGVQFTATMAGQAPTTICDVAVSSGNRYICHWNLARLGTRFQNGPVTFGFRVYGRANKAVVNPDGVRSGIVRYVETQPNDIYAGYAATGLGRLTSYTKVTARWTVPEVHCSPGETSDSAIWVGMTGISDRSKLAQIATESGCNSGVPVYDAGWEMFPAPAVILSNTVNPGDIVTATVSFVNGRFHLSMDDPGEGWHFTTTQPDVPADTAIAECITEAPTFTNEATNQSYVARLSNFGQVSIFCQINANHPIGDGPQNILYQMVSNGVTKATTSNLDQTGAVFTVRWHHG